MKIVRQGRRRSRRQGRYSAVSALLALFCTIGWLTSMQAAAQQTAPPARGTSATSQPAHRGEVARPTVHPTTRPAAATTRPASGATTRPSGTVVTRSDKATTQPAQADKKAEHEVVGFTLRGPRGGQRITILDMDAILAPDGKRFIPLLQILEKLGVKLTRKEREISFDFGPGGPAVIRTDSKTIERGGRSEPVNMIVSVSEITQKPDLFMSPETVSAILEIPISWDEDNYEFKAKTDRTLAMWKRKPRKSLLGIATEDVGPALPQVHDEAVPAKNAVDFMRLEGQATYRVRSEKDKAALHSGTVGGLSQTIWGGLADGAYKLRVSQPAWWVDQTTGRFNEGQDAVKLDWFQWAYEFANAELAVGDATFGLNEINMPTLQMSGVRFNGFAGRAEPDRSRDRRYGLRPYFLQPHVFEGHARAGSTVQLFINDRLLDTVEVLPDSPTKPGFGSYVFEDIDLVPGVLNDIRILITDPDGLETTLEKDIMGSSVLLSQGETAFLAGAGTNRRRDRLDANGAIVAGRALYGLTDRLTLGGTLAAHTDFWNEYLESRHRRRGRNYPVGGVNAGGQVSWLAFERVLLTGDVAASQGRRHSSGDPDLDKYDGLAMKFKADLCPIRNVTIQSQLFQFGRDFFDGSNPDLHDRRGATVTGRWKITRKWQLRLSAGMISNNVDSRRDETLRTNYQGFEVTSRAIPKTSVSLEGNRLDSSWEPHPLTIYRIKVRTTPFRNLSLMGDVSAGDTLSLGDHSDFLAGLKLPGITTSRQPTYTVTARRTHSNQQSYGVSYRGNRTEGRPSVFHSYRTTGARSLQVRTELGWDHDRVTNSGDAYFENRLEYLLDGTGRNRVGLQTRYQRETWTAIAYVNLNNLLAFDGARPRRMTNRRINPDRGAIYGMVFLDYNADAKRDDGEPGVEEIKVRTGTIAEDITDKKGRFFLPAVGRARDARVSLDMNTVPANFCVVHGTQIARLSPGRLTRVDLALSPFIAVTGKVMYTSGDLTKPLSGVRVFLMDPNTEEISVDSVTASDGSYYLGGARPGAYLLKIDTQTVSSQYKLAESQRQVTVTPQKEFHEMTLEAFMAKDLAARKTADKPPAPTTRPATVRKRDMQLNLPGEDTGED